jgi:hypothetical protein
MSLDRQTESSPEHLDPAPLADLLGGEQESGDQEAATRTSQDQVQQMLDSPAEEGMADAGDGTLEGAQAAAAVDRANAGGGGQELDPAVKGQMEQGFGASLDDVRVHTDGEAAGAAEDLNARAFTVGQDVYFNKGEYDPGSEDGQHLIAHEIAHTVQDGDGAATKRRDGDVTVSASGDAAEVEADRAADVVTAGGTVGALSARTATVHRDALGDLDSTSRGNWVGDVNEGQAIRRAAALTPDDKRRLATEARFRPTIVRLCGAFNASEMLRFFDAVGFFELTWKVYYLIRAGVVDELNTTQWRRVIGVASVQQMDELRQYPDGYRAFVRNGPDNLVPAWDRLQGLKEGWWRGDAAKIRFAVNSLDTAQRETLRGDNAMLRAIMTRAGTAAEKFRTAMYLMLGPRQSVYWLNEGGALAALTDQQWAQMLAEAPKAHVDNLVNDAALWALTQRHCPAPILQLIRQNTRDGDQITTQLQDAVSLQLLINSVGAAAVLALATQPGTDVAVNYGHIKGHGKHTTILNGLERGMRMGERTQDNLKKWFLPTSGESDPTTLELMMSIRFGLTVGGTGGPIAATSNNPHAGKAIAQWTPDGLRRAWQIMERMPPDAVESNPGFLHLLMRTDSNGGYYAGRDTNSGWDNSSVVGLQGDPDAVMSSKAIYGGTMPQFNQTFRHEVGHAVDNQLTIMASIQDQEWAGAWENHGSATAWVDAMIARSGGINAHGYPASDVGDYRAAMIRCASNATANPTFLTALNAIRAAKSTPLPPVTVAPTTGPAEVFNSQDTWHHGNAFWGKNAWKPQRGRNFVYGYESNSHWWSFNHAKVRDEKATDYQFRAPKEWFADAYAVYYAEQETNPDVPVGGLLRSKDQRAADFIANQIDRGYSPQLMVGGGVRQAPGTPGGVGG